MRRTTLVLVAAALLVTTGVGAAETGSVSGTVSVERASVRGDGPKHDRDVVIELRPRSGVPPAATGHATMDQLGLVFMPHVLAVQRGTTVTFLNSDRENHNVYFLDDVTGATLDIGTWGPGVSVDHTFTEPGTMITLCKLHLEMAAYVVITAGPWFTAVELDPASREASFELRAPPGDYDLVVWHKKLKAKGGTPRITVGSGAATTADVVLTKARFASGR